MSASNQYSPSAAAKNWKFNIIRSLKYCKEHGWLLSAGIALLAAVSVFNYSMRENVPINLTSASAIASLPAIFAAIACVIILLIKLHPATHCHHLYTANCRTPDINS